MHNRQLLYKIGNTYDCPADWFWQVDAMHDYDLWLVCAGRGHLSGDGMEYELSGGDCFIFRPGARFKAVHNPDFPLQVVAVHFETEDDSWPELTSGPLRFLHRRLIRPELTAGLMRLAVRNAQRYRADAADFWITAAAEAFFEAADGESESCPGGLPRLTALCSEISRNLEKDWTIEMIAEKLHYSADHCRRLFQRHLGVSPIEYVIQRRVEKACFLLQYTNLSLAEIAGQLNYQTIYYFSRQFKKVTGRPPGHYRKNH